MPEQKRERIARERERVSHSGHFHSEKEWVCVCVYVCLRGNTYHFLAASFLKL